MQFLAIITLTILVVVQECIGIFDLLQQTNVTTPHLVRADGYPLEVHQVTTQDGYILTMHRIPYSARLNNIDTETPKPIVFFQHGVLASSSDWIILGPSKSLGYLLSDEGYDVWMGNSRGNRYSMGHVELDYHLPPYWDFTWNEMGIYDLPACFDYITEATGVEQFHYVGHSQGTTDFFVYCTENSDCKKRIKASHLLAPVVFANNFGTPLAALAAPFLGQPDVLESTFGSFPFFPNSRLLNDIGEIFCNDQSPVQEFCVDGLFLLLGPSDFFNKTMYPFLTSVYPAGSSFKEIVHYLQEYNSGKFRKFDFGLLNLEKYGSLEPPEYNLSRIDVPIDMYYSLNDYFATEPDVTRLASVLPKGVVHNLFRVPYERWNHFDFLIGINVTEYLYGEVLKNIRETS